ncbi:hypothetical protein ES708_30470 [subsurface metagenome]
MAIKIKSAAAIAAKYARVTPGRVTDFEEGIEATSPDEYEKPTLDAEPIYEAGVTQAIARKAFGKGVRGSGPKWKEKSLDEGPSRFMTATGKAADEFEEGYAPYREVIADLTLPPRGPTGDPKNIRRVEAVATALRKKKTG